VLVDEDRWLIFFELSEVLRRRSRLLTKSPSDWSVVQDKSPTPRGCLRSPHSGPFVSLLSLSRIIVT
jgi:hypothetical protein